MWYHMTDSRAQEWKEALVKTADGYNVLAVKEGDVIKQKATGWIIQPARVWL